MEAVKQGIKEKLLTFHARNLQAEVANFFAKHLRLLRSADISITHADLLTLDDDDLVEAAYQLIKNSFSDRRVTSGLDTRYMLERFAFLEREWKKKWMDPEILRQALTKYLNGDPDFAFLRH